MAVMTAVPMPQFHVTFRLETPSGKFTRHEAYLFADNGQHAIRQCIDYVRQELRDKDANPCGIMCKQV
jgi:hypothetical protein